MRGVPMLVLAALSERLRIALIGEMARRFSASREGETSWLRRKGHPDAKS